MKILPPTEQQVKDAEKILGRPVDSDTLAISLIIKDAAALVAQEHSRSPRRAYEFQYRLAESIVRFCKGHLQPGYYTSIPSGHIFEVIDEPPSIVDTCLFEKVWSKDIGPDHKLRPTTLEELKEDLRNFDMGKVIS